MYIPNCDRNDPEIDDLFSELEQYLTRSQSREDVLSILLTFCAALPVFVANTLRSPAAVSPQNSAILTYLRGVVMVRIDHITANGRAEKQDLVLDVYYWCVSRLLEHASKDRQ